MIYLIAAIIAGVITVVLYLTIGVHRISGCMKMWTERGYWTNYNIVEFASWFTKAAVIVPGLVLGQEIWWLHFFTLSTSAALIWASMHKLLPTLVAFNTLWIFLSTAILVRHFVSA